MNIYITTEYKGTYEMPHLKLLHNSFYITHQNNIN